MNYLSVEEAKVASGLRVAFSRGIPVPWGIAIRAILELKNIDYAAVEHRPGEGNEALVAWTGQGSAPVIVYNDERTRIAWSEMLLLAEDIAPFPRLIPEDQGQRVEMMGLSYELCGESGLGWNIRLMLLNDEATSRLAINPRVARQYHQVRTHERIAVRMNAIIDDLSARREAQATRGSHFLVGDRLTAADIYWTAFSVLLDRASDDLCPITSTYEHLPGYFREKLGRPVPNNLIEHRNAVLDAYFKTPMIF